MRRRDRRGPGRHTHRHHRVDRLRRDCARGAAAALACRAASSCCSSATASATRPPGASSASCCKNDAFDRLRRELGTTGFDEMAAQRITTIAGDVGTDGLGLSAADRAVLASCDIVLHSAAAVSFDSPLDSAVEINLLGPTRIAQLLSELAVAPHLVVRVDVLRRRQPARHGARGAGQRRPVRSRPGLARPRSTPPAGCAATPRLPAASPSSWPSSARRPGSSWVPRVRRRWPRRPSSCASAGCAIS